MSGAATARAAPEGTGLVTAFKAPLLARILDAGESGQDDEQRLVVLDLGGPCQGLLDRLSETRRCRIEIADLPGHGGLAALRAPEDPEDPETVPMISGILPAPNDEPLDLILCWDLPNYLSLKVLRQLCNELARRAAPGCRLHMLIAYSRREMPSSPARYQPGDDGQLRQVCLDDAQIAAPRYSPEDLGLAVGGFRYERGVLLANGMQEFVYTWPG